MSNAPKYIIYKCNVCLRQTELVLDGDRPDPIRCNITEKCRGKLSRVGERSVREFLFTPLVPGLADFIPRGSSIIPAPNLTVPNPITIFSANGNGIIAMAVIRRAIVGLNAEFSIIDVNGTNRVIETHPLSFIDPQTSVVRATLYEISTELLTSSKYIYVISGPVSIVSGQDNSPEIKNLRFTSLNNIKVFVNGIEIPEATDIPPCPGFNRSVDNQITFDPTIYESNNVVEVFVYQTTSTLIGNSKQVVLEFRSLIPTVLEDYAFRELDCWGDYSAVKIENLPPGMSPNERFILFCTDLTGLDINKSYKVASFDVTISSINYQVKNSEVFILLGKEPFAFRDKELYAYLTGTSLIDNSNVLTYNESAASGSLFLSVDETAIEQVFNPIIPSRTISTVQPIASTTVPGTPLAGSENLSQKYIIGPT